MLRIVVTKTIPKFSRITRFFADKVVVVPPNPTMAESFGTKIPKRDLESFMDPKGFLRESEKNNYEDDVAEAKSKISKIKLGADITGTSKKNQRMYEFDELKVQDKNVADEVFFDRNKKLCETNGKDEGGFKAKGPEPTRYGDWERNGRCFDF